MSIYKEGTYPIEASKTNTPQLNGGYCRDNGDPLLS